ncbi:YfhE family protein [Sporosarcina sp. ACRSL]|nr:YfhE family protein [Sporosarcina sp. ACRSL]MCG7343366.1 YfhE family protein [Sporosarcina sp. ACRSL]
MSRKKEPHKSFTEKNNGLSATQEVLYAKEFKRADRAAKEPENKIREREQ